MAEQSQTSVDSFAWQWTKKTVQDSIRNFHRRLFLDFGIFAHHHDGKVVAYFGAGNGRHPWAINEISNPSRIIVVELAHDSVAAQRILLQDEKFELIQGDMATVSVAADFIYLIGVIQHTADMTATLRNAWACLNEGGELVVSFYLWTPATICLEPVRQIMRRLPTRLAWMFAHALAPVFMARRSGREAGYKNAVHTAYDWNGSHTYQHYSTNSSIERLFEDVGVSPLCIHRLATKGNYRLKKYSENDLKRIGNKEMHQFGAR